MASELETASDSEDVFISKMSRRHTEYLRSRLIHYLSTAKDISADIVHVQGQPAQMIVTFDSQGMNNLLYKYLVVSF